MIDWRVTRYLNQDQGEPGSSKGGDPPEKKDDPPKTDPSVADPKPKDDQDPVKLANAQKDEARDEAISERKKRQAAEAKVDELTEKQGKFDSMLRKYLGVESDSDDPEIIAKRAKADMDSMEEKAKNALMISAVSAEAIKQGAHDPEAVFALADKSKLDINIDEAKVTGAEDLVKELLEAKPYLRKPAKEQPGGGSPPGSDPSPAAAGKDDLEKLVKKAKAGDAVAQMECLKRTKEIKEAGIEV